MYSIQHHAHSPTTTTESQQKRQCLSRGQRKARRRACSRSIALLLLQPAHHTMNHTRTPTKARMRTIPKTPMIFQAQIQATPPARQVEKLKWSPGLRAVGLGIPVATDTAKAVQP